MPGNHASIGSVPAPQAIRRTIDEARQAARRGDWSEAKRCWDGVIAALPQHAPAYVGAGAALRELGRFEEADALLSDAAERFRNHEQISVARASLANARRDWPTALILWEDVRERFPDNPWCHLGYVHALRGAGRSDQEQSLLDAAERALAEAKQRGLGGNGIRRVELDIAKLRRDWRTVRRCAEEMIAADATGAAQVFLVLAQACWHLGDTMAADHAASRALTLDPCLSDAVLVRAWVATDQGDGAAALACYRRLAGLNPGAVRWSLKVVQLLNWLGHIEETVHELEKVLRQWPNDPVVKVFARSYGPASGRVVEPGTTPSDDDADYAWDEELQALAGRAPAHSELQRPLVVTDPAGDVLIARAEGANTVVLVFAGSNDEVSMPLRLFDRYLAALGVTVVYLKDFNRLRFLSGIRSLSENYRGTLEALRAVLVTLDTRRLCTIGNCDGAFAAIRYGAELCADRVLAFGAPTYSPQETLNRLEQGRNFMRVRLANSVSQDMTDLKPFLESHSHSTRIELFYEEEDLRDGEHASRLSGVAGVRLHPWPGLSKHHLLRRIASLTADFPLMLGNLLGLDSEMPSTSNKA